MDDRAPGVSAQLRKRIGTLLGAGETVSLRRSTLVLKDVVLTKANGSETPAAAEMRLQVARRGLAPEPFNLERWDRTAAVERIGDRTFAFDRVGARHLVTRRHNKQQVVTKAGQRFYKDAPLTQWIFQVPVANKRGNGHLWLQRYIPLTEEGMRQLGLDIDLSRYSFTRGVDASHRAKVPTDTTGPPTSRQMTRVGARPKVGLRTPPSGPRGGPG